MNDVKSLRAIIIVLTIFCILLFADSCKKDQIIEQKENLNTNLGDSLTSYINKEGDLIYTISTLESEKTQMFTSLNTKDSTINKLQDLVVNYKKELKNKGSAGIINTEGEVKIVTETVIDTVESSLTSRFNLDGWVWGSVKADKDTTEIDFKFKEEVSFVIGERRTGFLGLGKKETFSDVKLSNPYSTVKNFRTYNVDVPRDNWIITIGLSSYYDFKGQKINFAPSLNIGYKLFSF